MTELEAYFDEYKKKSRIFNFVHDSIDFYAHKSELFETCSKIEEVMTKVIPELKGIPLTVDFKIADLSAGEYYKAGRSLASFKKDTNK